MCRLVLVQDGGVVLIADTGGGENVGPAERGLAIFGEERNSLLQRVLLVCSVSMKYSTVGTTRQALCSSRLDSAYTISKKSLASCSHFLEQYSALPVNVPTSCSPQTWQIGTNMLRLHLSYTSNIAQWEPVVKPSMLQTCRRNVVGRTCRIVCEEYSHSQRAPPRYGCW